jgi:hypothetical protein
MSRVFDAYHRKSISHDWNSHRKNGGRHLIQPSNISEAEEDPMGGGGDMGMPEPPNQGGGGGGADIGTYITSYREMWQPVVDFVQTKLDELEELPSGSPEVMYLEGLLGILKGNEIDQRDAAGLDPELLRQKIDALADKIGSVAHDSGSEELANYLEKFAEGLRSFHNQIDPNMEVVPEDEEGPPVDGTDEPEPAPTDPAEELGGAEKEASPTGGEKEKPDDLNSADQLLKDLNM